MSGVKVEPVSVSRYLRRDFAVAAMSVIRYICMPVCLSVWSVCMQACRYAVE